MLSTLPDYARATRTAVFPDAGTPAGTVVLRSADLRVQGPGTVSAEGAAPLAGEMAVFCRPVLTAPAVIRRDGTVLADAWLPDQVRLGDLEAHLGDGVIEAIVDAEVRKRRLRQRQRRRLMSYPLVIRLVIAMTLMPDACYGEAMSRLAGLLADIPFALEWHIPTGKVITEWRLLIPAPVMEEIFWHAAGPLTSGDDPSAVVLAGLPVNAADGMLVNLADTPSGKKEDRIPVRVTGHNALFPAAGGEEQVAETCTVITTLLDHEAAPAQAVRDAYLTRRSASETTFGENKTTITGAGNRTSGPVLRSGCPRLVIQEAWAWLAGTQLTRAAGAAALRGQAAAARALRRKDAAPVTTDEESFTAARHHMIRSMATSQVTASSSLDALAAAADSAARAILRTLNVPGRERHSERAQKARPKFPHSEPVKAKTPAASAGTITPRAAGGFGEPVNSTAR